MKELKLNKETLQEIKEARERIKKGEFYTQEETERRIFNKIK